MDVNWSVKQQEPSKLVGGNSNLDQLKQNKENWAAIQMLGTVWKHKLIKWPALWAYVTNYQMDGQSIS